MKILREPLLHFLLLGGVIFACYSIVSKRATEKPNEIVISQGKIENMVTTFSRTWQRPPTEKELNGLIQDYVREEVAYREAKAMGLDQDDTIIRRRLRQKLEFISEDLASLSEPTDADLQAYLKLHSEDFKTETIYTFLQVYLNPQQHGANLEKVAGRILASLGQAGEKADLSSVGDSFLLDNEFEKYTISEVKRAFGEKFSGAIAGLTPGQWQGPVESGYGTHLVFVSERIEGRLPALEEVRDRVRREWSNARRVEANEKFYQALLQRYTVTIQPPQEPKVAELR